VKAFEPSTLKRIPKALGRRDLEWPPKCGKFVEVVNWWEDTNFLQLLFNKGAFILGVPTVGSPLGVEPSKPRAL